ncbi:MAG: tRNA modification GTPase [Rhodopirellula sp.]|nr:tRNA modification GTPase [Rhodopirellula sp.]
MLDPLFDSIAAVASPSGGAARGVLRLSGPGVIERIGRHFRADSGEDLSRFLFPTVLAGRLAVSPGILLPCDLYLWPTARSYTGQPAAEFHTLGSRPLLDAALGMFLAAGFRLAEPGEFTMRAFLAGRLDLTQAEAVLGVIEAGDARQLDTALAQLAGGLAGPLHELRDRLLDLLAHLEAGFDFADEDLPFITQDEISSRLSEAAERVSRLARQMESRAETWEPIRVALVGRPNVGKSSLFNALTGKAGALVFDQPGTTRDYLSAHLNLADVRCLLTDTAGIEVAFDAEAQELSAAAQAASREQARQAHVRLLCLDGTRPLDLAERTLLEDADSRTLIVLTKCDLPAREQGAGSREGRAARGPVSRTSSRTGEGIAALKSRLRAAVLAAGVADGDVVAGTAVRCHGSLGVAAECLRRALDIAQVGSAEELVAADVRVALEELGKVVGTVYTEDILDRIFSRFCIGK